MAERRSIYTQVTELTNRIKQQAPDGLTCGRMAMAQFVDNIVVDKLPHIPCGQKTATDLREQGFSPESTAPMTMTVLYIDSS